MHADRGKVGRGSWAGKSLGAWADSRRRFENRERGGFALVANHDRYWQFPARSLPAAGENGCENDPGASQDVLRWRPVVFARPGLPSNWADPSQAWLSWLYFTRIRGNGRLQDRDSKELAVDAASFHSRRVLVVFARWDVGLLADLRQGR